ncbi:putative secreted protein [Litoreibacter ponti]|uniref:Putative secreted protein n=1 Tax=Litoreibacter ponti TaxID=1510457 RepID=A0A2T6BI08_9RHOB|nr:VPLPA-CTERM sorting domain-containing protein [Litoreibacter ponti]PTX55697.1 putative secreted protein [Litoreibacter ponti]
MTLKTIVAIVTGLSAAGFAGAATAATTFTSEANYLTAIGGSADVSENFNSFLADQSFRNSSFDVGPFSLSSSGSNQNRDTQNQIDTDPFSFGTFADVNGSPFAHFFLSAGVTTATISFDTAITGFGATFKELATSTEILLTTNLGTRTINQNIGIDVGFFGFTLDAGETATALTFSSTNRGDGFGMDNVLLSNSTPSPVPLPAGLPLLLGGMGLLAFMRRRKSS